MFPKHKPKYIYNYKQVWRRDFSFYNRFTCNTCIVFLEAYTIEGPLCHKIKKKKVLHTVQLAEFEAEMNEFAVPAGHGSGALAFPKQLN